MEVGDLLESIPKLDDRRLAKHAIGVHNEFTMLKAIQVARDKQQVRAALDLDDLAC